MNDGVSMNEVRYSNGISSEIGLSALNVRYLKQPLFIVSMIAGYFWLLGSFYSLFFIGLVFSILRVDGYFEKLKKSPMSKISFYILFLLVAVDGFLERYHFKPPQVSILLVGSIVFLIYSNDALISFFSNRISTFF